MANLGTLDTASRYAYGKNPLETFNQNLARQISTNGSDTEKIAYLLGNYLGNYFGRGRRKKEEGRLDSLVKDAQKNPVSYTGDAIGAGVGNVTDTPYQMGEAVVSGGDPKAVSVTDEAISNIASNPINIQAVEQPTNGGMNNYNTKFLEDNLDKYGISKAVYEANKPKIERDIAQRAREIWLPQIQKDFYGTTIADESGQKVFQPPTTETILSGMEKLNEFAKYDPETAKTYSNLAIANMQSDKNNAAKLQQALAVAQAQGANRLALRNANIAAGYTPNGGSPRQARSNTPKVTMSDYKSATEGMDALIEAHGMDKIKSDPALFKRYKTFADVAQAYDNQINGVQQQPVQRVQQPAQQTPQVNQPAQQNNQPQQQPNLADSIRKIADGIDYSDFNSLNKSGMEMINQMTAAGVPEEQAMEAVGKRFYSKVKEGKLTKDEYRAFMGNYKTKEELNDEAILETDKTLHPEKYGIDSMKGLKDFFAGRFDDSAGRKKREEYLAKTKNQ